MRARDLPFPLLLTLAACGTTVPARDPVVVTAPLPLVPPAIPDEATLDRASATDEAPPQPAPSPPKRYRRVLSVGDSFNGALSLALQRRFAASGADFARDVWVGVAIGTFVHARRFPDLVASHKPDLVLITLGANDVDTTDLETLGRDVRAIVAKVGGADCVWIAPALWKKDKTGLVEALERNAAPCRFFASRGFKVERRGDGWHPSVKGGADWADRFWDFFEPQRSPTETSPLQGTSTL